MHLNKNELSDRSFPALYRDQELSLDLPQTSPFACKGIIAHILQSRMAVAGVLLVLFWAVMAILAPWLAPYDPNESHLEALDDPTPSAAFPLGADMQGRDLLSRILWGARTVMIVAPAAVICAYGVGCALGLLAGYYKGWTDVVVTRVTDIMISFPVLIFYMILISHFGPSMGNIVLAVTLTAAPQVARIVRALTFELREHAYVMAARMRGESSLFIMLVEILPNAREPLVVDFCLRMGYTIIAIGVLGYLGLGLPPPNPDWGGMVAASYPAISVFPFMTLFPSAAIASLVLGFNLFADGLRRSDKRKGSR